MTEDNRIPWSRKAEAAVLGGILLNNDSYDRIIGTINAEMFYRPAHQIIFRVFTYLRERAEPIDQVTASRVLKDRGEDKTIGGTSYLVQLLSDTPAAANVEHYAAIVQEYSVLRSVRDTAEWVRERTTMGSIAEGYNSKLDPNFDRVALAEETQRRLSEAVRPLIEGRDREIGLERMGMTFWRLAEILERSGEGNPDSSPVVNIGIPKVDKLFQAPIGLMSLLAGPPGSGKSILLKQILRYWSEVLTLKPHLVNIEDRNIHVAIRTLAEVTGIEPRRIRDIAYGTCVDDAARLEADRLRLIEAAARLSSMDGTWDQSQGLTVERIMMQCRDAVRRGARALALDIATKIKPTPNTGNNKVERLDHIIQNLAYIPQELNVPFIVTVHLKREGTDKPNMHSLRGSGDWENNARGIILTHVDAKHRSVSHAHPAELIIAKATHDRTGTVEMMLDKPRQCWREKRLDEGLVGDNQSGRDRFADRYRGAGEA